MVPCPQSWEPTPTLRLAWRGESNVGKPARLRKGDQNCAVGDHTKPITHDRVPRLKAWQISERHGQRQRCLACEDFDNKTGLNSERRMYKYIKSVFEQSEGKRHLLLNDSAVSGVSRVTQQGYSVAGWRAPSPPLTTVLPLLLVTSSFSGLALAAFASFATFASLAPRIRISLQGILP